ncbi:MAG TPA: hypothetical protein VHF88_00680 [Thermoleophilaceae bacterium]|nr:hypothetical protein [Thermoleophilaceae bacterium]
MVCAPVLLHGDVTLAGYLLDTTVAFHLAGSDYLLEHARNFARLPESSFRTTMENYFGLSYPGGGQTLLGGGSRLVGTPAIWLYQPLMALLLAFCAAPLYYLARTASMGRPAAAVAAVVASAPALVYAYAQMGAIKELAVLPFVLLLGPVLLLMPRWLERGPRGAVLPALVGAAGVGAIGLAFLPWLGMTLLVAGLLLVIGSRSRRVDLRSLGVWLAAFAVALVVFALPTFGALGDSLTLAKSLSTSNAVAVSDPGNLVRPLQRAQLAGIWIGGSHRVDPAQHFALTYALIGIMFAAAALGIASLVRRRSWALAGFVVVMATVWVALTLRGTAWTDAKLLVITSPIVVLLAALGADSLRRSGRRIEAVALAVPLVLGVLWSNALAYHETNLAPTERLEELLSIGEERAAQGPTLVPDFDEFALYALADMAPAGPGFSSRPVSLATLRDGSVTGYGHSYDLDSLDPEAVQGYATIVARRRPDASRPPANFRLAERGDYYDVWRRVRDLEVTAHVPAGEGLQAAGFVPCERLAALGRRARASDASLWYSPRPLVSAFEGQSIRRRPAGWGETVDGIGLATPGIAHKRFSVLASGVYDVWFKGDFARRLDVTIDGRRIGSIAGQSGNEGNYARPLRARLTAGLHMLTLERPGGSLKPGDAAPTVLRAVVFAPADAGVPVARQIGPDGWRRLCDRPVDWVEVARRR